MKGPDRTIAARTTSATEGRGTRRSRGYAQAVAETGADAELRAGDVLAGADVGRHVVRGGAQRAAGFVLTNLLSVLGAVLLLRYLGVEDFGRFGTVMALLAIVQGVSEAGLTLTGSREMAISDDEERREVLAHVLGLRIVLTGIGVVVAVAFAVAAGYDRDMVLGTLIAGVGIFCISVQSAMLLPLSIELRNGTLAVNEVLRQGVLVGAFAACVVAGAALLPFFGGQLLSGLVLLLATPLLLARRHLVAPRWSRDRLRALAAVGLPVAASSVLGIIYFRLLVVLMSLISGDAEQIGLYVTSARIVEVFVGLPFLLITVSLPVLSVAARDDNARLEYVTARTTEVMALGGVLIALVLAIAARPIVLALGGASYEDAVPVLQIQSLALITIFLTAAWNPTLLGMGRTRSLVIASGIGVAAVFAAGFALIPPLEAQGAAIAAVAADVVLCGVTYGMLRRAGPGRRLPHGALGRIALAALPAAALALIPGVPPLVLAVAAGALFTGLAVALHVVPPEIVDAALALGRRARRG